jgi:hypothetical protein
MQLPYLYHYLILLLVCLLKNILLNGKKIIQIQNKKDLQLEAYLSCNHLILYLYHLPHNFLVVFKLNITIQLTLQKVYFS